ncbi:sodium-dependent nutrient amino acid transporter 1-like isoform X1 [Brevipalpus obovatus]|uniref:sodium-dependent nutrient amino acid transporter 1-like isoform X1 n=1 Tax=Brevipalpus obovatus TaxID=246614 RepID=UPI003D9EB44C
MLAESKASRNGTLPEQMTQIQHFSTEDPEDEKPKRGQWSGELEFLLSCISMSVGLGNVWRFPYVAYNNGGGAFLIPYLVLVFLIGRPLYYLELVVGQFSSSNPINVWRAAPALKGIGFAQMISGSYVSVFYNYLMALTIYYFFASFQNPLPWTVCDESKEWSRNCSLAFHSNLSHGNHADLTEKYFHKEVLKLSHGLDEITWFNWKLAGCLFLAWAFVFLSIVKGVQSLGKVSYFTAIFPFVVLTAILVAALAVEGAIDGIIYFFKPDWYKLWDPIVWYNAVLQSFFSLGVSGGSLVMYASYNNFRKNVYKDVIIISVIDTISSLLAGCVIFSVLGSMAFERGVDVSEVANKDGVGLAFVAYPQALSQLDFLPSVWSIMFFLMLFTLGVGSSVAMVETFLTCLKDQFPIVLKHKEWAAFIVCLIFFLLGLPLTTDGGLYLMKLFEDYGVGISVFMYGIFETVGFMWIYGVDNLCRDIKFMVGMTVGIFWRICWTFVIPVLLTVLFIYGSIQMRNDNSKQDPLVAGIPWWGIMIGWIMAFIAAAQIPFWVLIAIMQQSGSLKERVKKAFTHTKDWGPANPTDFEQYIKYKQSLKKKNINNNN